MGTGYAKTDPTNFVDGETIEAADFTTEYNAIDAAFHLSTGHTHDGTTAEGGPVTKLLGTAITIGDATSGTDIAVTFDGESNDGVLTWMEDEDYFKFSDDALMNSTEKLYFRDTAIYINSSADGQLDLVADTEIQIAATTIDINGNVDISGTLTVAGALDFGDAALSNVGAVQLDSIAGDGDTNTSITFSGSDVITVANAGTNQITFNDGSILPVTDDDIDLGSSSYEFKDGYFDGTLYADAINFNGTAIASTAAELNIVDGGTSATSTTVADADRVVLNDNGTMVQVAVTDLAAYFDDEITAMPNLVTTAATTVGALNSGSITSGFGTIDTGSSTITTTGLITGGSLDIDNVLINGTTIGHTDDTDLITLTDGVVTVAGELDATTLDISGNADIDGTTNLDAVDIDGAVQIDGTVTVGVDGTGKDVKFFGDTSGAYVLWDESADKLLTAGGAVVDIVKDKLLIGSTAVTTTAAELNVLDAVTAGTVTASLGVVVDSNKDIGSFRNITLTGELDAGSLDISGDADIDGTLETDNLTVGGSQGSDGQVLTSTGSGVAWEDVPAGMTFQLEDGDGTEVAISNAKEVKFIGSGITTNWTDTDNGTDGDPYDLTFTVDAAQTGITSLLATDIKIGEDDQTKIDFETADEIHFYAANTEQVYVADNIFGPQSDSDVDLGTTGVRWKDAFVDSITVTGEIDGASLDISGDADIDGTANLDAIDVDGAANFAADVTFADGADIITASAGTSNFRAGVNAGAAIESGGNYNVIIGDSAGDALTTADNSALIGWGAGGAVTTGTANTAVGYYSLYTATTGTLNVAVGAGALGALTTSANNTAVGYDAGRQITTGGQNTFIGYQAGDALTTASQNTAVGYAALGACATTGQHTAMGHNALLVCVDGTNNTAFGSQAGAAVTSGSSNTFVGAYAGDAQTTASNNVAVGQNALGANTTGTNNVAIGTGAVATCTTAGNHLVGIGYQALAAAADSQFCVAIGKDAGLSVTSGDGNVLAGYHCGDAITTGGYNACFGDNAGGAITTASGILCLGQNAGNNLTTGGGGNAIYLGQGSQASAADVGGHETVIGPGTAKGVNTVFVVAGGSVYKGDNGTAWAQTSDRRIKKDIQPNTKGLAEICQVDPKTFLYKSDEELHEIPEFEGCAEGLPQNKRVTSAIAQEVQVPFPEAVTERNDYGMLSVNTDPIFWAMINSIKELSAQVDELKDEIKILKGE